VISDNVVPFDPQARGGMARRGAPDKIASFGGGTIRIECPSCGSDLCVTVEAAEGTVAVLCARCEAGSRVGACSEGGAG
jgi:hypothetical protein